MNKRCARCEKTVYPLEELKCLDKIWHKGCFKCQECAMTLSMKTYKGYNKLPYCEAHIPKAKATTVAETPEMRRLAENTKIQSNVQYHADFEKNKAKFTQVADDPETQRLKKNTQIISNVAYHGDLAKKEEMERKRLDPGEDDEERPPWHKAHGEDIVPANASVHPSKLPHILNDSDFVYDTSNASSTQSHSPPSFTQSQLSQHQSSQRPPPQVHHKHQLSTAVHGSPSPSSSSPSKSGYPVTPQVPASAYPSRPLNHQTPARFNDNPNPRPNYRTPSGPQPPHNANTTHYAPEYIEQSGHYPPNPAGGQNALNNRYSGKPTNGSSGSHYYSTNKHGAPPAASSSHSNYPINSHYATGAPPREESKRQQEQQLQLQMQQQQQQHQQLQKHHMQLQQQHQQQQQQQQQPPQQQQPAHPQQYTGPPPSSQHRHPPQQSSTTSFLHHQHHPQQPPQPYHHHQQQQQQQQQQQRPKQNPQYHHHPTAQNLHHDTNHNSPYSARTSQTLIYSSQTGPVSTPSSSSFTQVQQPNRRVGSIADYDPVNEQYGSISQPNAGGGGYRQETTYQIQRSNLYGDQVPVPQHANPQMNSNATSHHKVTAPPTQLGRCYRAMYDYEAADTDEVSFKDGDLIINCTAIDEGWMTGTIQRTGITGMLPANYVERVS